MLLVLDEYEKREYYEECAIIKEALDEHNSNFMKEVRSVSKNIPFPTNLVDYESEKFQKILDKYGVVVTKKVAKEKATLIKLKLPIKNGLSNNKK